MKSDPFLFAVRGYESHPSWVRGLKFQKNMNRKFITKVAPFVGAGIEIISYCG